MSPPALTTFRERVRRITAVAAVAAPARDVVVLAIDGVPFELARELWAEAEVARMRSVFPSTSCAAWLSSLTGMSVDAHGVVGAVFRPPGGAGELVHLYEYDGPLCEAAVENVFGDAAALGFTPIAVMGDLEPYACSWRDLLLRHAEPIVGHRFYAATPAGEPPLPADELCRRVRAAVREALGAARRPAFVWCFVEPDRHVHYHGYDAHVGDFLTAIDRLASELVAAGAEVVAYSDHGLVPTRDPNGLEPLLRRLTQPYGPIGGAGRTRWVYADPAAAGDLADELAAELPDSIAVHRAGDLFAPGSRARACVGEVVLIAGDERFVTTPGYRFDHGSLTPTELNVPLARWCA